MIPLGLVQCVGDAPVAADAGADAAGEASAADVVTDAPADGGPGDVGADAAPACDVKKNFANLTAVTLQNDVNAILVYAMKVRGGHTYVNRSGQTGVEQGTLANHTITFPGLLSVYPTAVLAGVDVSSDELSMVYSTGGGFVRVSRSTLSDTFKTPVTLTIPVPQVDASLDIRYHVAGTAAQVLFTRVENSAGPASVAIYEARADADAGANAYTVAKQATLSSMLTPYMARPVLLDENHVYLAGWGSMNQPHQRLLVAARPSPAVAWSAPTAVTIDGFIPKSTDDVVLLETTQDDCTLYVGVSGAGVDGPYSVYEARRPQ
jgi:hypothetical protein